MALDLAKDFWWMKPIYGDSLNDLPKLKQFLIEEYLNYLE